MTVLEIARIYIDLVKAEREIPEDEPQAKEKLNALRTKYHELLMAKMREDRIDFSDRFDAAAKAFDLVREEDAKYGKTTDYRS
jgi:hypothetical protein